MEKEAMSLKETKKGYVRVLEREMEGKNYTIILYLKNKRNNTFKIPLH